MKFSIIGVPWERRVQTTFVFAYLLFILTCLILWLCCLLNPILWIFYIPYVLFVKYIDNPARNGGRPIKFFRNSGFWKRFAAYFPATLQFQNDWHKTADEKDKYLLALHPHGIVGLGVWANVLSNGSNLHTLLPGLNLRVVTLPLNFLIPIWREFIVSLGLIDSHEQSIVTALSKGASVGIVVGGAAEALNAIPGKDYVLTLKNRRGFIRIAMKQGVPIVPVFSFGENDLFHLADHPLLRKVQNAAKNVLGFSTPLFIGRGIFNYSFGLLPHRKRIVTIIGKPIPVKQVDNPSGTELDEMHKIYTTALREMYYAYRDEHDSNRELIID